MASILDAWSLRSTTRSAPGNFAVSSGTNRVLLVAVVTRGGATNDPLTSLSYGGEAMTKVQAIASSSGADMDLQLFRLNDAGIDNAANANFTTTPSTAGVGFRLFAAAYADVDQSSPIVESFGSVGETGANPASQAMATTSSGVALAILAANQGTGSAGATEDASYSNLAETIEEVATNIYASIADANTDGSSFTPGTTLTHEQTGILIGATLRNAAASVDVGLTTEIGTAPAIVAQRLAAIGVAEEAGQSLMLEPLRLVPMGPAVEADSATAVTGSQPGLLPIERATESSIALSITPTRHVAVGIAQEADSAFVVTFRREVFVDQAREVSTALNVSFPGRTTSAALVRRDGAGSGRARLRLPIYPPDVERLVDEVQAVIGRDRKAAVRVILRSVDRGADLVFRTEVESGNPPSRETIRQRTRAAFRLAEIYRARANERRDHLLRLLNVPVDYGQAKAPRSHATHLAELFRPSGRRGQ